MSARLVVFAESRSFIGNALVQAVIDECRARTDVEVVAVLDTARTSPCRLPFVRTVSKALAKRLFDAAHPIVLHGPMWRTFHAAAGDAAVPVLAATDVNDPAFVEALRSDLRPDLALSLICLQIFGADLLASLPAAVNYHNGLLPAYRGLRSTGWSVYNGEERTGFSFHRMREMVDAGPVLHEGAVPVHRRASVLQLEWAKTMIATTALPAVLTAMLRGDAGAEQHGPAAYYSAADARRIIAVGDPSSVTWDDLVRRVRAFGAVDMTLRGEHVRVTRVEDSPRGGDSFVTADGVVARATRLRYLPPALYRVSRSARVVRPS